MESLTLRKLKKGLLVGFLLLAFSYGLWCQNLEIHFINVQQGQSVLIKGPDGTIILYDGGDTGMGTAEVIPYLQANGIPTTQILNYIIASHQHDDHIAGLTELMGTYDVNNVYYNGSDYTSAAVTSFTAAVVSDTGGNPLAMVLGDTIALGNGAVARCVAVDGSVIGTGAVSGGQNNENDRSICLLIQYGDFDLLLTGDAGGGDSDNSCTGRSTSQINIETPLVQAIMPGGTNPLLSSFGVEIAQVGHHGSESSCNSDFMNLLTPAVACIPVGAGQGWNWYHPRIDVVENVLLAQGACITAPAALVLQTEEGDPTGTTTSYAGHCVGDIIITTSGIQNYTVSATGDVCQGPCETTSAGLPVTYNLDEYVAPPSSITVTNPMTGKSHSPGKSLKVEWASTGITGEVKVVLRKVDGTTKYIATSAIAYDSSPFYYTIPVDVPLGAYFVRVAQGEVKGDSGEFDIGTITVTSPSTGTYSPGDLVTVAWTTEALSGTVNIFMRKPDGSQKLILERNVPYNGSPQIYTIPAEAIPGIFYVKVRQKKAGDKSENITVE